MFDPQETFSPVFLAAARPSSSLHGTLSRLKLLIQCLPIHPWQSCHLFNYGLHMPSVLTGCGLLESSPTSLTLVLVLVAPTAPPA